MRAILYAAKSTDDKHGSIKTQLKQGRERAEAEGWEVVAEYQDEAKSAFSGSRGDGLVKAKEHAERIAPCALIVQHSDRLARGDARTAAHLVEHILWSIKTEVALVSLQDPENVRVKEGDESLSLLLGAVGGMRNNEDSKRKAQATKDGKRRAFEAGKFGGGPVPDGYLWDPHQPDPVLEVDPARAPIIRQMAALRDEGLPYGTIARRLNAEGERTRKGKPWKGETIKDMLANPVYAGRVHIHRDTPEMEVAEGKHEALIDPALFDRIAAKSTIRVPHRGGRPSVTTYLTGLAICGRCGSPIWGRRDPYTRKDGSRRVSYRCSGTKSGTCDLPRLDAALIDAALLKHLADQFIDIPAWAEREAKANDDRKASLASALADRLKELAAAEKQRDRARDRALQKGTDAAEELYEAAREKVAAAEAEVAGAQAALDAVPTPEATNDAILDFLNLLRDRLRTEKRELNTELRAIFARVTIDLLMPEDEILLAFELQPDVVDRYGSTTGEVQRTTGDDLSVMHDANVGGNPAEPLMMLVAAPPTRDLAVPIETIDNAEA